MNRPEYRLDWISKYKSSLYGLSILWIMAFHSYHVEIDLSKKLGLLGEFLEQGNMGVEIFLMISGICLYFSFVKNPDYYQFIKKRLIRIIPTVYLIYGPYWIFRFVTGRISIKTFLGKATVMRFWFYADKEIWFVSLILVLYFLYPYIYRFLFGSGKYAIVRTLILMVLAALLAFIVKWNSKDLYSNIEIGITRFPAFILGCYLGKHVYEKKTFPLIPVLIAGIILTIGGFACFYAGIVPSSINRYCNLVPTFGMLILLPALLNVCGRYVNAVIGFFGIMSLELYLSHMMWIRIYLADWIPMKYSESPLPGYVRYIILMAISALSSFIVMKILDFAKKLMSEKKNSAEKTVG